MDKLDWIVVPGGPGLPEDYIKLGLDNILSNNDRIHYYTPYGSTKCSNHDVSLNELVEQVYQVACEKKLKYFGLIGHSFGTYLALRVIENYSKFVKGLLMISPMPLLYSQWRQSIQNVINKVTPSDNSLITKYTIENNGSEVLKLLFPYYIANSNTMLPSVNFNMEECNKLEAQVPEYNDTEKLRDLTIPFYCICGNQDPFYYADTVPMANTKVLPNTGHYPFYEDIELFKTSLIEAEKALGFSVLS